MAKRIQRERKRGWRMPKGAVYVGRPSRWGNPHLVGDFINCDCLQEQGVDERFTRERAVEAYREYAMSYLDNPAYYIEPLRGHDLACWCPEPCGVDVDLGWGPHGGPHGPCALPADHEGYHDPSAPPFCHADIMLELANA